MAFININGVKIYIEERGTGLPLLLIHGVGGDSSQMDIIAEPLSKLFKVISMDCRGHGKSDKPLHYILQNHIMDVLGIMDHLQIEASYLLGVSMGSYIAQGVAIQAPQRISKLILTVPKSNGLTSSVERLLTENAEELKGLSFHETMLCLLKYLTYDPEAMKAHIDLFETKLSSEQFAAANNALAGFDFRNDLPKVAAETLVISGKHDGLNPPQEGALCASFIPNAAFVEMQYSGHAPMYEESEHYLEIVKDFLINKHSATSD